jgi:hypothetical protein
MKQIEKCERIAELTSYIIDLKEEKKAFLREMNGKIHEAEREQKQLLKGEEK